VLLGILVGKGVAEIRVVQICHAHHSRLFPIPSFIHTCAHSLIKGEAVSHPRLHCQIREHNHYVQELGPYSDIWSARRPQLR